MRSFAGTPPAGTRSPNLPPARLFAVLGSAMDASAELTPALARALGGIKRGGLWMSEAEVNGSPSMLIWADSELFALFVPVIDGGKITALYTITAPDKLAVARRQARVSRNAVLPSQ